MEKKLKVLIADDHSGMLQWMASELSGEFEIVGAVRTAAAALEGVKEYKPDVLVVDISMPSMNGFEVFKKVRASGAPTAVILVTTYTNFEFAAAAREAGVHAFIEKSKLAEELAPAVRCAKSFHNV